MDTLPKRRKNRLEAYDYSRNGVYFVTICTRNMQRVLGEVFVGRDDPGTPQVRLSKYGEVVRDNIERIEAYYEHISVDKHVVMPNHVHIILAISDPGGGVPRSSRPTAAVPSVIAAFKKFTAKGIGKNIWQTSFHDRIIRTRDEYLRIWQYIDENPAKWEEDAYYSPPGITQTIM